VERVVFEAARHLKDRCSVAVLARGIEGGAGGEVPAGVSFFGLGGRELPLGFGLRQTRRLSRRVVARERFDVVAGFGVQAPEDSVVWMQSVHAVWWEQCRRTRRGLGRWMQAANPFHKIVLSMESELLLQRRYRRLIALTPQVKEDLVRCYGVNPGHVEVLPNGFHPEEFHPGLREAHRGQGRRLLGIPESSKVVLFVANEWERKGLIPLMEALAEVDEEAHLVAVGRLPKAMLTGRAERLGLAKRVHIVGPTSSVNRWFGLADAFALPTSYEAWGMVLIEALASGLPVLTSRCAGAAAAVLEGKNGFLLEDPRSGREVASGLEKLLRGVGWSREEVSASVVEYEWPRIFERYEAILRTVA
jgi:UDP-glucose:(heptosyl)LPS alpha-1,3-glucosyltransferase